MWVLGLIALVCLLYFLVRTDARVGDEQIAKWVMTNPAIDKWFWSKVAGVSHDNLNGMSRQQILRRCEPRELLTLAPEPRNPVDPHAIAVLRKNGEQIGYLNSRLGRETYNRMQKGEHWGAMLTVITGRERHPHGWLGANIVMLRFTQMNVPNVAGAARTE